MSSEVSDPDFLEGLGLDDGPSKINGSDQYPKGTTGYYALNKELNKEGIYDTTHLDNLNAPLVRVNRQEEARKKQEEARKKQEEEEAYAELMADLAKIRVEKVKKGGSRRRTRSRGNKRKSRRTKRRTRRSTRRSRK